MRWKSGKRNINFLDDYLFAALWKHLCDSQVNEFIELCNFILFPVNLDKTFWGSTRLVFLGLLIDTVLQMVFIPIEKVQKANNMLDYMLNKQNHKVTLKKLQSLAGFLNFLSRCVVPGCTFTHKFYVKVNDLERKLQMHHHIRITAEMKADMVMWKEFLSHLTVYCRPFPDFSDRVTAYQANFFTDASGGISFGALCYTSWIAQEWDHTFIKRKQLDIECLEMYALMVAVELWIHRFKNRKIIVFCDNQTVCRAVNKTTASCTKCMIFVRRIIFKAMMENVEIFIQYIKSRDNKFADFLSRGMITKFKNTAKEDELEIDENKTRLPEAVWPMSKLI